MQENKELNNEMAFIDATGPIAYPLRTDTMIHYVTQNSQHTLKHLISSLKEISYDDIQDIQIMNPSDFTEYDEKKSTLDLKVKLNNGEIINVELQMYFDAYWINRSLLYLCKAYNSIEEGESYSKLMPTTQICITDKNLFEHEPEFYSHYLFMNVKNHQIYTKNLAINVLQLNQVELATDEDKAHNLDHWARLFVAETWEEMKTLVTEHPEFEEAVNMIYKANADDSVKYAIEAENKFRAINAAQYEAGYAAAEEKYADVIKLKDEALQEKDHVISEQGKAILEQKKALSQKDNVIESLQARIAELEGK